MSYTKGPWHWRTATRSIEGQAFDGSWRNIVDMVRGQSPTEADANMKLISAAPDLLEAAKRFTDCDFDSQGRAVVRVDVDAIEALRAAVRKAEGAS